jgi:serine/alanine adding enzyme
MELVLEPPVEHRPSRGVSVFATSTPDERCDEYVSRRSEATGYHRTAWAGLIATTLGRQTRYLVAESGGRVTGVLPLVIFRNVVFGRSVVSMPFLNYGGVVADDPASARALLDAAIAETVALGGAYLELRHRTRVFPELQAKTHKVAMVLRLPGSPARQWDALDRKVRNQVRKAEKLGVRVDRGGAELLPSFYEVFARNMRDLGTPVYPLRFFRGVLETFPDSAQVFRAMHGGRAVAASITWRHGGSLEVPWASSLRASNAACPNMLLYWEMLKYANEQGLVEFDFGRCTPFESTYAFKQQWGAEPRQLVWEYWLPAGAPLPDVSPRNPRYAAAIAAWRRLPLPVTQVLGPWIVRHIP